MGSVSGRLLEEFPVEPGIADGPRYERWENLLTAASNLCGAVLDGALRRGRIDAFEAGQIRHLLLGSSGYPLTDGRSYWPDLVRAVERIRELARRERADRELSLIAEPGV